MEQEKNNLVKRAIKITLIQNTNPYSSVIQILDKSKKIYYYIKFIHKSNKYIFRNHDLTVLFGRNRLFVSSFFENQFSKIAPCRKYLPDLVIESSSNNFLIYKNNDLEQKEFSKLIYENKSDKWINRIMKLVDDFSFRRINKNVPEELNNPQVLKLKMDLQIIKPLSYIFSKREVELLLEKIGPLYYLNHGDLQPKNILLSDKKITIIDFEEGFFGPEGWDLGFLWGNIFYLSITNKLLFSHLNKVWINHCLSKSNSKYRFNLFLFTLSTLLFRLYLFPLITLSKKSKFLLKRQIEIFKKYVIY